MTKILQATIINQAQGHGLYQNGDMITGFVGYPQ